MTNRKYVGCSGRMLEPEGYGVVAADNGRAVLELQQEYNPDLVILDIMMPGLDGFQVLDRIRQRSNVPVIMLTGRCEVTALRDALSLGADDYVRKPFGTRELLARIRTKLRRAELLFIANKTTDCSTFLVKVGSYKQKSRVKS